MVEPVRGGLLLLLQNGSESSMTHLGAYALLDKFRKVVNDCSDDLRKGLSPNSVPLHLGWRVGGRLPGPTRGLRKLHPHAEPWHREVQGESSGNGAETERPPVT